MAFLNTLGQRLSKLDLLILRGINTSCLEIADVPIHVVLFLLGGKSVGRRVEPRLGPLQTTRLPTVWVHVGAVEECFLHPLLHLHLLHDVLAFLLEVDERLAQLLVPFNVAVSEMLQEILLVKVEQFYASIADSLRSEESFSLSQHHFFEPELMPVVNLPNGALDHDIGRRAVDLISSHRVGVRSAHHEEKLHVHLAFLYEVDGVGEVTHIIDGLPWLKSHLLDMLKQWDYIGS